VKHYLLTLFIPSADPVGWIVGVAFIVFMATGLILSAKWAHYNSPLDFEHGMTDNDRGFLKSALITYFAWGTAQQLLVQGVFLALCLCLPIPVALMISIMIFGWFHAPNILLVFATAALGTAYCLHFSVWHNLYLLGFGHGILATILKWYWPQELHHGLRIWNHY
jgi:hypothetical protein